MSQATVAPGGTVAGRPQPQTTAETAGGPFIRHAPDAFYQLVQMKDAFGTQLLTGPGYAILRLVNLYSGQFGVGDMRDPQNSPQQTVYNTTGSASATVTFGRYLPFEFAKAYGVISGANAALLPVLQLNTAPTTALWSANTPTTGLSAQETLDSDFYWLPSAPADPPGLGTTCQWIYQPSNPTIPASASQLVQLPRLGGYLTVLILEIRDSAGARDDTLWPARPKILVDGVPLIDTLLGTWQEDMAISMGVGAGQAFVASNTSTTQTGTVAVSRPAGTMAINRKTSLAQMDHGLLDTGEIFLSTNPGTQLEVGGFPWGAGDGSNPHTLNALVGQVVPSGTLVQGLPEL